MTIEVPTLTRSPSIRSRASDPPRVPQHQCSFMDEHTVTIFNLLTERNMMKLPEAKSHEEVGKADDPYYPVP